MAYRTTHDTTLLTHFVHVADAMLTDRDDFVGQRDYRGAVAPGWSTERQWNPKLGQNVNGVAPMRDLAQDANIVCPYLQFCEIVFADTAQLRIYKAKAEYYLRESQVVVDYYLDNDWDSNWQRFVFPKGSPVWCDGVNVPNNYEALMGSDLLMLYKLDDDSKYLNLAAELAEHLKESLITVGDSEYVWPYWSGKSEAGWSAGEDLSVNTPSRGPQSYLEDISHGGVDLSFMEDCYDNHFVFNRTDMNRFVGTFQGIVDRNTFLAPDLPQRAVILMKLLITVLPSTVGFGCVGSTKGFTGRSTPYFTRIQSQPAIWRGDCSS